MADDKSKKTITAKDVASFLTDNPAEMSKLLATQPELLAACITAAGTSIEADDKIDDKVVNLIPALAAKARQDARKLSQTHQSLLHVAAFNMEYSPDTWYAEMGSVVLSLRARMMSKYAPAGLTIIISAPSASSSAASRKHSR